MGAGWLWGGMALVLGGSGLGGAAPHTPFLGFFFLTCAMRRLGVAWGGSAHVISCFFTFWRVRCGGLELGGAPPHTPFLAFFFLTCAIWWFGAVWGGSAHVISYLFLFGVCTPILSPHSRACTPLKNKVIAPPRRNNPFPSVTN